MNEYSTKYMEIQEDTLQKVINKEMTVVAGAERLGISRPTLYERLKRYERYGIAGLLRKQGKKRGPAHNRTPEDIEVIVTALAEKWVYGRSRSIVRSSGERTRYLPPSNHDMAYTQTKE